MLGRTVILIYENIPYIHPEIIAYEFRYLVSNVNFNYGYGLKYMYILNFNSNLQEMDTAMKQFADSTKDEDSCAVVCLLSHGGNGYLFGKDGKKANTDHILRHLDNEKCPQMMGKPKIVVIQACNGVIHLIIQI